MKAHDISRLDGNSVSYPVVKVRTGGGALESYEINELHDGDTYTLPLANSVDINGWVLVELPELYSTYEPIVQRSGSDTIIYSGGSDTEVIFDAGTTMIRFVSNGVDEWRI